MNRLNKGKELQEKAKKFFELEEFRKAVRYYTKAEQVYRDFFPTPGDRIYFMQVSILRCLEYQLDDYPSIQGRYLKKNNEFFDEWNPAKIKRNITPERIEEALVFYSYRKAANGTQNIFQQANSEINKGNIEKAKKLLDAIIENASSINTEEKDAIIALAKAKKAVIGANAEREKRRYDRNLRRIAALYHQAAGNLQLPRNTKSKQGKHIKALRYLNLSYYHKWVAICELTEIEDSDKPARDHLRIAYIHYDKALTYAKKEKNENEDSIKPLHVPIMAYKTSIVEVRLFLFEYMETGKEETFERVFDAWNAALNTVNETFQKYENEEEAYLDESIFFEGRYYTLEDFKSEKYFLLAAKFFRLRKWGKCVENFEKWHDEFPNYHQWSWRYLNIYVRMLGAEIIEQLDSNKEIINRNVFKKIKEQQKIIESESVGGAARYFGRQSQSIINRTENREGVFTELDMKFPLDAQAISYGNNVQNKFLDTLPPRIKRELSIPIGNTAYELTQCSISLSRALESILGYIQDYGASWKDKPAVDPNEGLEIIFNAIRTEEDWAKNTIWEAKIREVINISNSLKSNHQKNFTDKYEDAKELISDVARPFMPLIVKLENKISTTSIANVKPLWSIERNFGPNEDSVSAHTDMKVRVERKYDLPISPGFYYLPPNWRSGNRFYYPVDSQDNQPLHPVRFQPRRDFWEKRKRSIINEVYEYSKDNSINAAIRELEEMIESSENHESKYQELFIENPWFFGGFHSKIERHIKLDDQNIPDFTGIRAKDGFRDIFEVKPPFMKCFRGDDKFTAEFHNALDQAEKYLNFVREQRHYLRDKELEFENPRCYLLLGNNLSDEQLNNLRIKKKINPSIYIYTYQELIALAKNFATEIKSYI